METNYELKHKCLLVPLKVVLLVLAMALVGSPTFAQSGKSIKVANDEQLIEAMDNPSVETIVFQPGYYALLNINATSSTTLKKSQGESGNRSSSGCTYTIRGENYCYRPTDVYEDPNQGTLVGWSYGQAEAGVINLTCLSWPVPCCPDPGSGRWSVTLKPAGASDPIYYDTTNYLMDFYVDKPGKYKFKYTWDPADNPLLTEFAEVETEYNFYGPLTLEFTAPDVCGYTTFIDFTFEEGYDPQNNHVIQWYIDFWPYGDPVPFNGPQTTVEDWEFTAESCGLAIISVEYTAFSDCFTVVSDEVEFSCEPEADAGDDVNLCDETCYYSLHATIDVYSFSPTHAYSWVQVGGTNDNELVFDEQFELVSSVCVEETECPYGEYEVEFQVQNGLCYDEDNLFLRFYEQPVANAGDDQHICNEFAFSMTAVPYDYCGVYGENHWGETYWEVYSKADPNAIITFTNAFDPETTVGIISNLDCPFGEYVFVWHESNTKGEGLGGCFASDTVSIFIYPTPEVDAGDDLIFCDVFEFALDGTADLDCARSFAYSTVVTWEVVDAPGECDIEFAPSVNEIDPSITIDNCGESCAYGVYTFMVTQQNGYWVNIGQEQQFVMVCEDTDEVSVWIYETPEDVYAGDDQHLCNDFAFSLQATGSEYCGDYGVNYENWYSWVVVSGPENVECEVTFSNPTGLSTDVIIENCVGECAYGEWVFGFAEYNGPYDISCGDYDEVSVFIYEMPEADAGDDVAECVEIGYSYCYTMYANLEYCYTMQGVWTKSCGPGDVVFDDIYDPNTEVCFAEPGHYVFTWTLSNAAAGCEDSDDVIFDLIEQPTAIAQDDELIAECDTLCIDLELAGVVKYEYFGTDEGECPNYQDLAEWTVISGPGEVTFADDNDPATDMCVTAYGCYTVRWTEINKQVGGELTCEDYVDIFVVFVETPTPDAGDDASVCDACYTMDAEPYLPENCTEAFAESYWEVISYEAPEDPCLTDEFAIQYYPMLEEFDINDPNAHICVVDDCLGSHYGTYGFRWVNASGFCIGYDTVYIEFKKTPEEVALAGSINPSNCYDSECDNCEVSCLYPGGDVIEVCADACINLGIDWSCFCNEGPIPGYTYEWSFIGPAGSYMQAEPYWYDCDDECWRGSDDVFICFGECCDTARLYLTITSPQGCTTTEEWKFYVNHKPCANIEGPEVAEVGAITTYCNVCPEEYDMDCLLYTWTAEHCGEIVEGQGTECIEVLWTDYNANGGWGEITLTVFDTCTGCCNYDELFVQMYPAGTLGDATLSGHVLYKNNYNTPLNGVEVSLWNGDVEVMTTTSFNDVEGDGVGYFEFSGINGATEFGITTSYDAAWPGANATDALAVQLYAIGSLPLTFDTSLVVKDAMNVNNNITINSTDALWIKQRAINMVNYFPAGNWASDPELVADASASPLDIYVLGMGDANRSNVPNSNKSMPAIDLVYDGTMNVVAGEVFELPIRIAEADQFGAITLSLDYNSALIEVVDVVAIEGMLSNIANGAVNIAWSNLNPMVLADNDVVVTLKVKATGEISTSENLFSIGINSEFADPSAKVIEPVTLKSFGVTTSPAATDYFLSTNRPNPFNTSTFIEYTMPETGKVKLSVLDMLGQELAVLVDATQTAGSYTVEFSAAGLATGVYIYKITVDGETRDFISTQRMVISH